MNVTAIFESVFRRIPDGTYWTPTPHSYEFFRRYLSVFSTVTVVARVQEVTDVIKTWHRADGPGVSFVAIPPYHGPGGYILHRSQVRRILFNSLSSENALILHVPSPIAGCLAGRIGPILHPYGVEVLGDPWDVFAPGAVRHPLRPFFRWHFHRQLKKQCIMACAAAYVTESALQKRYPIATKQMDGSPSFSTSFSSIELGPEWFAPSPRKIVSTTGRRRLLMVGSLAQMYKAPDILVKAVAECLTTGIDLELEIIGDGKCRREIESLAQRLGVHNRIHFAGELPSGSAIQERLDRSDCFVLPSRTEGLPRAIIEAMARALPCIGSTAGGIPELLPPEDLVPPGDVNALAQRIRDMITDPARMARASARNLERSRDFRNDILRERRTRFYQAVAQATATWQSTLHPQKMSRFKVASHS